MPVIRSGDGTKLHFNDVGEGRPVVLIHGWPLSADMWEYQLATLLDHGFRVVSYDRRGFGRSGKPATGYDYDTFADDLHLLMEHLDLQDAALVGFSMGGGEVARYLSRYGSRRVAKAVLISSIVPYQLKTDTNPEGADESAFLDMIRKLKEDRPAFLAAFAKDFYGVGVLRSPVSEQILQWTSFLAYPASPVATVDCVSAFGKTDFRSEMEAFTMPTLIIHGTGDKTVPIAPSAEAAASLIPHADLRRYEGAPHGLFITHKDRLNQDLVSFLSLGASKREDVFERPEILM